MRWTLTAVCRRCCAVIVVAPLLSAALAAQSVTAIVHGQVIDGEGGPPIADGVVLVRGDRITAVGAASIVTIPKGATVIDARGRTVMPGLADMHVHLTGGWDGETSDLLGYRRALNAMLYAGVTTTLDLGNVLPYIQQLRDEVKAGRLPGPAIHMAGSLVDGPEPFWPPLAVSVTSSAQLPMYAKMLKRAHADVVKGYVGLTPIVLSQLVQAAAAESLRVFVDAGPGNGELLFARTGIAAFAHLGNRRVTDDVVTYMRDHHVASITTLAVMESFSGRRVADPTLLRDSLFTAIMPPPYLEEFAAYAHRNRTAADSASERSATEQLRASQSNAKRLFDAGVLLAAGTDAPYPGEYYGDGLHRELELLVEAGLTPLQAITVATKNAARLMREESEWGTLAPGKRADVLVVAGDPTQRIADTRRVAMVMQAGRVLDRAMLRADSTRDPEFRPSGTMSAPRQ